MTNLILVVDDDRLMRVYLCELLKQAGYQVVEASNGLEAIATYIRLHPDIVLLDAMMPVMDGFSCCTQLQALPNGKDTPVLIISALDDGASVEKAFAAGATDFITKPIQWPILRHRLRRYLEARRVKQELQQQIAQLQQQQAQLEIALDGAGTSIWNWDMLTNKITYSGHLEALFGWKKGTFNNTYDAFLNRIHRQDREFVKRSHQQAIENGVYDIEFRVILPDGSIRYLASKGVVCRDADSAVVGMSAIDIDITKRKQAEEMLGIYANQQAMVAELSQIALADIDLNALMNLCVSIVAQCLKVEYCKVLELVPNGNALVLRAGVGWQPGLVGNATVSALMDSQAGYTLISNGPVVVDDLRTETRFNRSQLLRQHQVISGISVVIHGKERHFGVLGAHTTRHQTFTKDEVGFLQSVANILAAAIERQRGENAPKESEERCQLVVQANNGGIWDWDLQNNRVLQCQNMRSQLFAQIALKIRQSLQIDEILRTSVTEVQKLLLADRVLILCLQPNNSFLAIQEAVVPGFPAILGQEITDCCFSDNGIQHYRQGRISSITDIAQTDIETCHAKLLQRFSIKANLVLPIFLKNQLWGLLIVHQCAYSRKWTSWEIELLQQLADQIGIALTHSQILEQETRQRQELARSNQQLQEFAFIASHDLQEPLRKIKIFGDRLQATCGDTLSDGGRDLLERMQNTANRMQTLIEGLLALSRVTTTAQPFVSVNLSKIAQEVLSDLEVYIQQTGASVEIGELPTIKADPLQIRQLLQNLIVNALKFHRPQVRPIIKIYSHDLNNQGNNHSTSSGFCQIVVEDNGIGFEERDSDRIFNLFQRLDSPAEYNKYQGTGIGLAICRKITERHHGKIVAESKPGHGSKFFVTLAVNPHP
ncbi:MAG: GAF domain-containing protein [Nostoc sp. ChiSLP02]|nr:GAF domain-containing protein [Nostoc sp. DedSLP05]MDZ8099880.1 GAF domain-containing protein [Nostoc sp. DedSLP01]MDZ8186791.1 GAF domain-containing protein [Nostoc sp. ChiSLP02]